MYLDVRQRRGSASRKLPEDVLFPHLGIRRGSYKGAINFVQGRFNMGGTGVLPFCGEKRKIQLIVSRAPDDVVGTKGHEWAYTIICFFPSAKDPSWRYMVGPDGQVLTAGSGPLKLVPLKAVKSGVICKPLERAVPSGTLVKMYDFKAPRSNVCGELYKKLGEYLIQPAIPLRIIECRKDYQANVMGVTLWDRLGALLKNNELEDECRDGIGVTVELSTGEQVPAEVRVFRLSTKKKGEDVDEFRVGLRALINGQSHAKRGPEFVRAKGVGLEHIAGSMLVTLDCTRLCQQSRNDLFMANRETFRSESALCEELFKELKEQLRGHDALKYLNHKRYEEKVKTAVDDEDGIKAMEDLLAEDPELAELFGGKESGATSSHAPTAGGSLPAKPEQFKGAQFPSFFRRADGSTSVEMEVPRGGIARVAFHTDVRNNYFTRKTNRGTCKFKGDFAPSHHLYNGRLTLACRPPATAVVGTQLATEATITDPKGSGPFTLMLAASVVAPKHKKQPDPREKKEKKSKRGPSRPRIRERDGDPTEPPIEINREPKTNLLEIIINRKAAALEHAKAKRPSAEEAAVEFVFKYGLALLAMSMIDRARETEKWDEDEPDCRKEIGQTVSDLSRVIVPLCLNLPQKLPKAG
ncbi:MAG: hypothetical protein IPK00_27075 [Deltaproteobacteria bacterium]|nr:hypothetical protein [Deltaproteobacteria bacterium]